MDEGGRFKDETLKQRVLGSLFAGAVADAFGNLYEGKPNGLKCNLVADSYSITSDDTQLTLATCESIVRSGGVAPEKVAEAFLEIHTSDGIRGVGSSTLKAMRDLEVGAHWYLAGARGERAAGNGAAMRIAPLGFLLNLDLDELPTIVRDVSSITHHNDEAYAGALAVVLCIRMIVEGRDRLTIIWQLIDLLPDTQVRDCLKKLQEDSEISIGQASEISGTSGFVAESVPLAIFAGLKGFDCGLSEIIETVVGCGGDTDTIGSMAGQIAGAILGVNSDLLGLLEKLDDRDAIRRNVEAFAKFVAVL